MTEGPPIACKVPGDPTYDMLMKMIEALRRSTAPHVDSFVDPEVGLTVLMTAAAMFSGIQAGTLMSIGAFRQQDQKRLGEAALANFREGIKFGLRRGMRIGAEEMGGTA